MDTKKIYPLLDDYLQSLDLANNIPDSIFSAGLTSFEEYETYFMYSFNCFKGCLHSYKNIKRLYEEYLDWINGHSRFKISGNNDKFSNHQSSAVIRMDRPQFAYEIYSFVSSLKSSLDFLVTAYSLHHPNKKLRFDSIGKVLVQLQKGNLKDSLAPFYNHKNWLISINDYRNALIHRTSFNIKGGFEDREDSTGQHRVIFPIIIPRHLNSFQPDTRRIRANADHRYDSFESEWIMIKGETKFSHGKLKSEYSPAPGYIEIFNFLETQIKSYEAFFEELIQFLQLQEFKQF